MFHCVVSNNQRAFKLLLDKGADPEWRNRTGRSVLSLIAKANLVEWAELTVKGMSEARRKAYLNQGTQNGA